MDKSFGLGAVRAGGEGKDFDMGKHRDSLNVTARCGAIR